MKMDSQSVEEIIDEHKSHLKSISDGVIEGAFEGVKKGVAKGFKTGVKDGLKECFAKGFVSIGLDDIEDILEGIPQEIIKKSARESTKHILKKTTGDYVGAVCQKLAERIHKEDIGLSEEQIGHSLALIQKSAEEAMQKIMKKLPNNPFAKGITVGIQNAMEESLKENLRECEERLRKAIEK